jgi:hypothetical protein
MAISLAVLAVVFVAIAWFTFTYVRNLWDGRHDIAVDWDAETPEDMSVNPVSEGDGAQPYSGARVTDRMLVVDLAERRVVADLGDVDEIRWISDDVLVAFGSTIRGDFEGLAVVNITDQSVEQVDVGGRSDTAFSAVALTDDGRLEVCSMILEPGASSATCGPEHFVLDPATAELTPA